MEYSAGIDGGGIFKEFLNELIRDALSSIAFPLDMRLIFAEWMLMDIFSFDPERGLFLQTENTHELYPNPNYSELKVLMNVDKDYFEFLGKMVGKAIYDFVLIEPIFAQFFLRKVWCSLCFAESVGLLEDNICCF